VNENFNEISEEVVDSQLRNFFDNADEMFNEWINTSLPILSGQMPSELFASAEGRKKIVYILGLMANGDTA
tara:strand:- start:3972 stop:4184 length:213 start_codon:yes stop_codon:yes gene_type:complete